MFSRLLRYFKVYAAFAHLTWMNEMEYRTNFWIGQVSTLVQLCIQIFFFKAIYQHVNLIGGWSQGQVLFLIGTYQLVNAIYRAFVSSIWSLTSEVESGALDLTLVKPLDSQFMLSFRGVGIGSLVGLFYACPLLIYAGRLIELHPSKMLWGLYGLLVLNGVMIKYCIALLISSLSFWMVRNYALQGILADLFDLAGYPDSIFRGILRGFLTLVFPVLLIANAPARVVFGTVSPSLLVTAGGVAVLLLVITRRFWLFALRHYSSASS